jgi:hypothetical protein
MTGWVLNRLKADIAQSNFFIKHIRKAKRSGLPLFLLLLASHFERIAIHFDRSSS